RRSSDLVVKIARPCTPVFATAVLNGRPFRVSAKDTDAPATGPPLPLRRVKVTRSRRPCRAYPIAETRSFAGTTVTWALAVEVPAAVVTVATTLPVPGDTGTNVVELPD